MTLRRKMLLGHGLVLLLVAVVCAWAVASLWRLGSAADRILRENYLSIQAAESMIGSLERQDSAVLLLVLGFEEEGLRQFNAFESQFLQGLGRAKGNVTVAGEGELLAELEGHYLAYLETFAAFRRGRIEHSPEPGGFYHQTMLPVFHQVRLACARLREMNEKSMLDYSRAALELGARATGSTAALGGLAVCLGLGFSLFFSGRLVRPLKEMIAATGQLAAGDYEVRVATNTGDELGVLARGFLAMSRKLKSFRDLNLDDLVAEKRRGEAVIHSVTDGLLVVDKDYRLVGANPVAEEALGISLAAAQGRHVLEAVGDRTLFTRIKAALEATPAVNPERPALLSVELPRGARHYEVAVTAARTDRGQLVGAVALLKDVTKLKELDRLKSEFVMTASHELRTPLSGIILSLGNLGERAAAKLDADERAMLATAGEEARRLAALVGDLLDLSKLEAGRLTIEPVPVALGLLAHKALTALRPQAERQKVELSESLPPDLPPVLADPHKIAWVFTNLLGNALRYTPEGGHIRLGAQPVGGYVHASVADDGAGIPEEEQAHIFEKFAQRKDDRTPGASGLGLALCRELLRAHHGTIWVDSQPGHGATFTFSLPLAARGGETSHS